jgi:hypothetical protein
MQTYLVLTNHACAEPDTCLYISPKPPLPPQDDFFASHNTPQFMCAKFSLAHPSGFIFPLLNFNLLFFSFPCSYFSPHNYLDGGEFFAKMEKPPPDDKPAGRVSGRERGRGSIATIWTRGSMDPSRDAAPTRSFPSQASSRMVRFRKIGE